MLIGIRRRRARVYTRITAVYDNLPLAAIVGKKVFCVHGGKLSLNDKIVMFVS